MKKKMGKDIFARVVRNAPLVAVDLIVKEPSGRILLGLRNNEPAKDYWFVPGGVLQKDESIAEALRGRAMEELGIQVRMEDARMIGVFEHFYDTNFTGNSDFGTHYIVLAYEIQLQEAISELPPDQHREYRWFSREQLLKDPRVHENTKAYFAQC
jgi:colanic acid biosynthesis protein WcaH